MHSPMTRRVDNMEDGRDHDELTASNNRRTPNTLRNRSTPRLHRSNGQRSNGRHNNADVQPQCLTFEDTSTTALVTASEAEGQDTLPQTNVGDGSQQKKRAWWFSRSTKEDKNGKKRKGWLQKRCPINIDCDCNIRDACAPISSTCFKLMVILALCCTVTGFVWCVTTEMPEMPVLSPDESDTVKLAQVASHFLISFGFLGLSCAFLQRVLRSLSLCLGEIESH